MTKFQQTKVLTPPTPSDKTLQAYSGTVQQNLADLWNLSHNHVGTATQKAQYAALTTDADRITYIATLLGLI